MYARHTVRQQAAGTFHGHALFGIRGLSVQAPRLQSIVEDCATAAKSSDARDKYFATYVGEFASCSSKQLRSELPSLEVSSPSIVLLLLQLCEGARMSLWFAQAARASVAAVTAELAEILPKLSSCRGASLLMNG